MSSAESGARSGAWSCPRSAPGVRAPTPVLEGDVLTVDATMPGAYDSRDTIL